MSDNALALLLVALVFASVALGAWLITGFLADEMRGELRTIDEHRRRMRELGGRG